MPRTSPFAPALFEFLAELQANNEKAWFEKHKARYEECVREPSLEFIRQVAPRLGAISEHFVASDRKVGGSLMRIHRDTRFSGDKSPYKTNVGIQFRHEAGKDVHAPGFYVHLAVDECFVAAGMWHPESGALDAVRQAIVADPKGYERVARGKAFLRHFELEGESLKRAPKGYDPSHALVDELRRKNHIAVHRLDHSALTAPGAVVGVCKLFETAAPYMKWMCKAVGVAF